MDDMSTREHQAKEEDVLTELLDRTRADSEFREHARRDLEGALEEYGYELSAEERKAVLHFQAISAEMDDEEFDKLLAHTTEERQQRGTA